MGVRAWDRKLLLVILKDSIVDLDSREDYQYDLCWKRGKYSCLGDSRDMLVPGDLFWACSMESA